MVAIKNVKRSNNTINLSKSKYKEFQQYVPSICHKTLEFILADSNYSLANALRRTLVNELPINYLTASLTDIQSSDKYIINDIIKSRLEMIPIPQDIDVSKRFSVKFENNSETYCNVNSSEIKYKGKSIDGICSEIPLCSINSTYVLTISDISVNTEYGYNNGKVSPARIEYEIINHDMVNNLSTNSDPSEFRFLIECPGVYNPDYFMNLTISELKKRLDNIDISNHVIEFNVFKLTIPGETYTIGKLLSRYIYDLHPSIDYVNMRIPHPSERLCILDIKDSNAIKLLSDAIIKIKKDLDILSKSF